jgi:hypothetical protein
MFYTISRVTYADNQYNYINILSIDPLPQPTEPLAFYVKQLHIPAYRISAFRPRTESDCIYALCNTAGDLLTINNLSTLFTFCRANGYTIETDITNMVNGQPQTNQIICYISFNSA